MKRVCVALLVVCALQFVHSDDQIAVQQMDNISNYRLPQHRDGFIEFMERIVQQTIQLAKDAITVLQSRIDQLFKDVYEKLFGLQQMGDEALNAILKDLDKVNSRMEVNACVQEHMEEIRQLITNARKDISKCIQTAMGEAEVASQRLYPYVESIASLIQNVTGVIDRCSTTSNPFSVAMCITQHVTEITDDISAIIRDSQEAIKLAIVEIKTIILNTTECVKTSVDTVKTAVQQIVNECIQTNQK